MSAGRPVGPTDQYLLETLPTSFADFFPIIPFTFFFGKKVDQVARCSLFVWAPREALFTPRSFPAFSEVVFAAGGRLLLLARPRTA